MNILSIGTAEIELHGFENIRDIAYFIFRKDGLVIVDNIDEINADYLAVSVTGGIISNDELRKLLLDKGFDSDYAFVEHGGEYYYFGESI